LADIYACPFCRQLFTKGEASVCPECEVTLKPLAELPPSLEAQAEHPDDLLPPEDELLPWSFTARARGPLILLALAGMGVFFAPWLHEQAPEIRTLSGFGFARELPWLWGAFVGWFVMFGLVASRRTIRQSC